MMRSSSNVAALRARPVAPAAALALALASCGGETVSRWLEVPQYSSSFLLTPGGNVGLRVGPRGEGVGPLVIALEGADGGPVPPPLVATMPPILGGDCKDRVRPLGPSSVFVWGMCQDLPYLLAIVTADPAALPGDVPLRVRLDYQEWPLGPWRRAVAPLTVSIRPP